MLRLPLLILVPCLAVAQQVPDGAFRLVLSGPEHTRGSGPVVKVDEGHHNFQTLGGGYCILGRLLEADGYRVARMLAVSSRTAWQAPMCW